MARARFAIAVALIVSGCATSRPIDGAYPAAEFERVLAAEDARASSAEHEQALRDALRSEHAVIRAMAVRALGRTERKEFATDVAALLTDPDVTARAEAAHALGNITRDSASGAVREILLRVLPQTGVDAVFAAAVAETLGRLAHDASAARIVAERIAPLLGVTDAGRRGALRGLYFLARQPNGRAAVAAHADKLSEIVTQSESARDRALALSTSNTAGAATHALALAASTDTDWTVRREAVIAAGAASDEAGIQGVLDRALRDAAPQVRYEAVRVLARRMAERGCGQLARSVRDPDAHVAILALNLSVAPPCRTSAPVALLDSVASALEARRWQRAAAAIAALAAAGAPSAAAHTARLAAHGSPFARTYAARAAGALRDATLLRRLAADEHPNVRTTAVTALGEVQGHAADSIYVAQLDSDDSELLQAAARALEGSDRSGAAETMLDALDRITRQRSETSRDARAALLVRLRELGTREHAQRLEPYRVDFDPAIANAAADVIHHWTGTRAPAAPQPLSRLPLPQYADLERLARSSFGIELEGGGTIEIALLPFIAPTNAWRFARLAREGYYDGLTIHRVVPNFVVQGGSPGANEYSGHPLFTRDELGAPNWRGSVGLSTRGRDTGDAQFYINLIDNVRLDHDYTIFGTVTRGMEHVDGLLEGTVIRRIREVR